MFALTLNQTKLRPVRWKTPIQQGVCSAALTCVNADAALGAADEQAGPVVVEMGRGCLLLRLGVLLGDGGEACLGDQRLGAHAAAGRHDGALSAAGTLRLERRRRRNEGFPPGC